jgi:hypothetical protein
MTSCSVFFFVSVYTITKLVIIKIGGIICFNFNTNKVGNDQKENFKGVPRRVSLVELKIFKNFLK